MLLQTLHKWPRVCPEMAVLALESEKLNKQTSLGIVLNKDNFPIVKTKESRKPWETTMKNCWKKTCIVSVIPKCWRCYNNIYVWKEFHKDVGNN